MQLIAYMSIMIHQTLPIIVKLAIWGHILGGSLALLTFTIPLLSKKGGQLHVRSGWFYTIGMFAVATSALTITPWRIFFDAGRTQSRIDFSIFLFFIAIFSLATLQQGLLVIRHKRRTDKIQNWQTLTLPIALTTIGILIFIFGLIEHKLLFAVFAALGTRTGWQQIRYWQKAPTHSKDWFFAHLNNMFICCIATLTAFTVTALPRIFVYARLDSLWVWLAPTLVMVPWMMWFELRYKKYESRLSLKFDGDTQWK